MFILILFNIDSVLAKDTKINYSKENISNYFSGIISINQNYTTAGFKYLNKVQSLSGIHQNYNIQFINSLVLLGKFEQAFAFSKDIWKEDNFLFEADLILGLDSLIKKDYSNARKYFERLNKMASYSLFFEDFFGNLMISWTYALENNKNESFRFFDKVPNRFENIKKINHSLLNCYFNSPKTEQAFYLLIDEEQLSFSRYYFFLANYLLSKKENKKASEIISNSRNFFNSNLLLKETENFIKTKNYKKVLELYNCKEPKDAIAEIFYVVANLYSSQKNYKQSNFYLKLSLLLNKKFIPNKALLAENYFFQKKYELSKKTYESLKIIGPTYQWHSYTNLASILSVTSSKEKAVKFLEKKISLLKNPNFENYYDMGNFFKEHEYYKESVKYYSLALEKMDKNNILFPKVLDRRGTSYERMGDWEKAEKDLLTSIDILPDQPHTLNYLAYSWIEKRINIEKSIDMLKKANELRKNDGYIIDSLGWGYYVNKNYVDAKKYLERAVRIFPLDPVVNDHYADTLWMLNKPIQARYFWKHVLSLDEVEEKLKNNINKKLIYGIKQQL